MPWNTYLENLAEIIEQDPQPAGWIRAKGTFGDYNGWGDCVRIPYQAFIALTGFQDHTARFDSRYAYTENLKLIARVEDACPWKGALVITGVPDINGQGAFTFTLTAPPQQRKKNGR
jgi:hypothetical protein